MNIALVANDSKKTLMENLCVAYRHILIKHDIYATGTTGQLIEDASSLPVHKYLAGDLGGEQQLASQISNNEIDVVIFLRDTTYPAKPATTGAADFSSALHLCDMHNIPLATNLATAETLLLALDRGDLDWRNLVRQDAAM